MKKQLLTLALSALSFSSFAKIMIVDNNGNNPQNYTSLQKAIDDSGKGDTLYVKGSSTSYGDAVVKKSLVLIGDGYAEPTIERPNSKTTIGTLTFESVNASNSEVRGVALVQLSFQNATIIDHFKLMESNVRLISSNNLESILYLEITNNYIGDVSCSAYLFLSTIANNQIDRFYAPTHNGANLIIPGQNHIKNNIFRYAIACEYAIIKNNFFYDITLSQNYNNWYIDNISYNLPVEKYDLNNNQLQGNILGSIDNELHVYDTAGQVHDEVGIFAGTYAWVDGTQQQPGLMPSVHSLNIDNKYLPSNDTLKVNFKAKSIRD